VLTDLPTEQQWSLAIHLRHGTLDATEDPSGDRDEFYFYRVKKSTADSITLRAKGRGAEILTLTGDPTLIGYLRCVLPSQREQTWGQVKKTLVPRDMAVYQEKVQSTIQAVSDIRRRVAGRQSVIDRIVLDLYGITDPEDREIVLGHGSQSD
jgi:hypothetical protein